MNKKTMYGWAKEEYPTNEAGNYIIPLADIGDKKGQINFHKIVLDNNRYYGSEKYIALKHSIEENGYDSKHPIWIWRNKIVDGWHRTTAAREVELENIEAIELPYNTSLKDIEEDVIRTEIGRQMSKSDLAIKAWKKWKDGTFSSVAQAALKIGSTKTGIKAVSYVAKHGDEDWINEIYNGKEVRYGDGIKTTDNIFTIKAFLEKEKANELGKTVNKQYRRMTDPEVEMLKKQISSTLEGVAPENIEDIAKHIYHIYKSAKDRR